MQKYNVRNTQDALAYLTDCTLATVCDMAQRKSKSKSEYARQIDIAQAGFHWMHTMKVDLAGTRAEAVMNDFGGSVKKWACQFEV